MAITTLFGLQGAVVQRGAAYDGFMPGYAGAMSNAEAAGLLNWILEQASWKRPRAGRSQPATRPTRWGGSIQWKP